MSSSSVWDDYGYHHDDLVEPESLVPVHVPQPRAPQDSRGGCSGRERREHTPVIRRSRHFADTDDSCVEVPTWWGSCFHEEACARCGVVLRCWIGREECPDISPA